MNPTSGDRFQRILCAIDALSADAPAVMEKLALTIRGWARAGTPSVDAVFVENPASCGVLPMVFAAAREEMRRQAESALQSFTRRLAPPIVTRTNVLLDDLTSIRSTVLRLQEHAEETGAQLAVLSTHARVGFDRWLIGSFAEGWLARATIPTLTINPSCAELGEFRHALVPTDLSDDSVTLLAGLADHFAATGARLTLFFHGSYYPLVPAPGFLERDLVPWLELKEEKLKTLAATLSERGARADWRLDPQPGDTADRIVTVATESGVDFIALESRRHPLFPSMLGRIPRQVVRRAGRPVLVLPSH